MHPPVHRRGAQEAPFEVPPVEEKQAHSQIVSRLAALERDQQNGFAQQHETQEALHALTARVDAMDKQLQKLPQAKLRKLPEKLGSVEAQLASFSPSKVKDIIAGQQCCEAAIKHVEEELEVLRNASAPAEVQSIVKIHAKLLDAHRETAATHRDQLQAVSNAVTTLKCELAEAKRAVEELAALGTGITSDGIAEVMEEVKQIRHGLGVVQLQAQSSDARTRVAIAMASRNHTVPPGQFEYSGIPWGTMHPPVELELWQTHGVTSAPDQELAACVPLSARSKPTTHDGYANAYDDASLC